MELFEESFAEFYDSLRINFLYSQIMMESENSSKSILDNIKEFFENIIKFIKKLADSIKEKFSKINNSEVDAAVKEAMEKINSDPTIKAKHVDYFDYAKYQKNVNAFMTEVTTNFDKLIKTEMKSDTEKEFYLNKFNNEIDKLYKKYNLDDKDKFKINSSIAEAIQKTYKCQKQTESLSNREIKNWDMCIKNMQKKAESLDDSAFGKIKSGITKFNGFMGKAFKNCVDGLPKALSVLLLGIGIHKFCYNAGKLEEGYREEKDKEKQAKIRAKNKKELARERDKQKKELYKKYPEVEQYENKKYFQQS